MLKQALIDAENKAKKRHLAESKKASLKNMPVVAAKKAYSHKATATSTTLD
jgi:hypothetical protein